MKLEINVTLFYLEKKEEKSDRVGRNDTPSKLGIIAWETDINEILTGY